MAPTNNRYARELVQADATKRAMLPGCLPLLRSDIRKRPGILCSFG